MPKLTIKAQYAYLVAGFQSTEKTRYYLNGFCAQSSARGVILVATDGHRLGAFCDSSGFITQGRDTGDIWQLPKDALKACASVGRDAYPRWLVIAPIAGQDVHTVAVLQATDAQEAETVAQSHEPNLILYTGITRPVNGIFPDWRRVVPSQDSIAPCGDTAFNAKLLEPFAKVASTNEDGTKKIGAPLTISETGEPISPLVILTERTDFIGVLMPVRGGSVENYPAWLTETAPKA